MNIKLITPEAAQLYMNILDYFIWSDDPKYSRLHQFRNRILKIKHKIDKETLIAYFEEETKENIEYFTAPY